MRTGSGGTITFAVCLAASGTAFGRPGEGPPESSAAELSPILERAGRYVLDYEEAFQGIAADEKSTQWTRRADTSPTVTTVEGSLPVGGLAVTCSVADTKPSAPPPEVRGGVELPYSCTRTTKADVVFVRLAGAMPWGSFRDVYEVDGKNVREREPRLERLFSSMPPADAEPQARGLSEASDQRFNIGPALRDVDAPPLSLMFLHPKNQPRFAWARGGKRRLGNIETVEIKFEEVARPTIVSQAGHEDLPASGRLWVDPVQGTLVRSEIDFRFEPRRARASVATEYRLEPTVGTWVPVEVHEEYDDLKDAGQPLFGAPTKATAQFSNFRRLSAPTADRTAGHSPVLPTYTPELAELLRRVGEYVAEYEHNFGDLLVEETYSQNWRPTRHFVYEDAGHGDPPAFGQTRNDTERESPCVGCRRTTRADLVFVRLTGEIPWASYRDVFEVDGHKVREHEQRLVGLLSNPSTDTQEQARKLLAASAAYNIGPVRRTINLPTLPLLFLLPRNQGLFEFQLGGRRTIGVREAVELVFRETSRNTLVKGPGNSDLPARGRFWIHAADGTVVRSEVEFAFGAEAEARLTTDYRPEAALAMWVPSEMTEHYADVPRAMLKTFQGPLDGVARYEHFRRFTVSTEEQVAAPQP